MSFPIVLTGILTPRSQDQKKPGHSEIPPRPIFGNVIIQSVLLAVLIVPLAGASELDIQPPLIELDSSSDVGEFNLRNQSTRTMAIRARAVSWRQLGGHDSFTNTSNLVVSPATFTLEPGADLEVRISLRYDSELVNEAAYRIFFDEMTAAGYSKSRQAPLSFAAPVFVAPNMPFESDLEWSVRPGGLDGPRLLARNPGTVHVQVTSIMIENGSTYWQIPDSFGYLLAGQKRSWKIPRNLELDPSQSLTIIAVTRHDRLRTPADWDDW